MTLNRLRISPALALFAAAPLLLTGCWVPGYWPGGSLATRDIYTYESTVDFQQSVQLTDVATNDVIWSINIPVGKQVVIRFQDDHDPENVERPALMRWELMERGRRTGELYNAIPAPAWDRRLMEVFYRDADVAPGLETGS
jgi:hypothetical protein